jgi:hypothetical protein
MRSKVTAWVVAVLSILGGLASGEDPEPQTVVVASGAGATAENALKNAFANAVEQAVGLVVDAETIVKNDKIIREQVLTYSNAYISKYEELGREKTADGLITVRIKAIVEKKKLAEKLAAVTVTTAKVEGRDLFARAVTQLKEEKDAAAINRAAKSHLEGRIGGCRWGDGAIRGGFGQVRAVGRGFQAVPSEGGHGHEDSSVESGPT